MRMGKSLFVLALLLWGAAQVAAQSSSASTNAQVRQNLPDLPQGVSASWWQQVQANLRQREYHISKSHDGRYIAPNRAQNLRFVYEPNGFSATRRDSLAHLWQARLTFIGTSKRKDAVPTHTHEHFTLTAHANTLVAESETVTITYLNNENGMRQDFVVKHKPEGQDHLCVLLKPEMQHGTVRITNTALSFLTANGQEAMRYSGLKVWDARHKPLKAYFEQRENYLAIVVSDKNAQYPITIDPLSTTPDWAVESNQSNAWFGWSVASAGDVNGDGFSDVIVGARQYDNGETDEGAAFVYHGSFFGLSTTPDWTAESNQAGAEFGISVASAGDVNGDGFSDVIVGAWYFDNSQTDEGAAFVYHGSALGLNTTADWTTYGGVANAWYGFFVASAGDVNNDGFSDVIVGAPNYLNQGAAYAYYGSSSGLNTVADWFTTVTVSNALYGRSVASAGDVNGDGYSDVIVGSNGFTNTFTGEGAAFVYHGSALGLNTSAAWVTYGNQTQARYGVSVASAGDVNGDGFSDVIVGAWGFDAINGNEGAAFVWCGSANGVNSGVNGTPVNAAWAAFGSQVGMELGSSVASAGDVNGDGFSDVIVGAWLFSNGEGNEGAAFVYHGSGTSFVTQTVSADGLYTFPPTGVSIFFSGVSGSGTCKVVRYDNPASNRAFAGGSPTSVSPYRFVIKATGFTFTNAELRFNRTQIPNAGIGNANTVIVYRRPTPGTGANPTPGSGRFVALSNAFNSSFPDEVRATTTSFSEFLLGSNDPDNPLPVELSAFTGAATPNGVRLQWTTQSEQNNAGFEVRRKAANEDFVTIASYRFDPSLRGKGTTTSATTYSFLDENVEVGKSYTYRLRSVDFDGTVYDYAQTVSVEVREPVQARVYEYALEQNYPNPFNPATTIRYSVKELGKVSLRVYDVMGREVMVLVDRVQGPGEYAVAVDGSKLSSGVYFYQLRAGGFLFTRKMMLVK